MLSSRSETYTSEVTTDRDGMPSASSGCSATMTGYTLWPLTPDLTQPDPGSLIPIPARCRWRRPRLVRLRQRVRLLATPPVTSGHLSSQQQARRQQLWPVIETAQARRGTLLLSAAPVSEPWSALSAADIPPVPDRRAEAFSRRRRAFQPPPPPPPQPPTATATATAAAAAAAAAVQLGVNPHSTLGFLSALWWCRTRASGG